MTDSARKILLSGAWICQESFIDSWINCTPCCETIIKTSRYPWVFLSHTKRKREATERWFMLARRYHFALAQVDLTGTNFVGGAFENLSASQNCYFRCWWLTPLFAKQMKSIFALSHTTSTAVLLLDSRIWIPLRNSSDSKSIKRWNRKSAREFYMLLS